MKAVQTAENVWFIPERGGTFRESMNEIWYQEVSTEEDCQIRFGTDERLPRFLFRCGYTLVWLDGRVESATAPATTITMTVDELAKIKRGVVAEERRRIKSALDRWEEDVNDEDSRMVGGIRTTKVLGLNDMRAIVGG